MKKILLVILVLILSAGAYLFFGGQLGGERYVNTKFGYELVLPRGFQISDESRAFSVAQEISSQEKYGSLMEYDSAQAAQAANPALVEAYSADVERRISLWATSSSEHVVLERRGDESRIMGGDLFAEGKVVVSLTHSSSKPSSAEAKSNKILSTELIEINDVKGFIRRSNFQPNSATVVALDFESETPLANGELPNSIVFVTRGDELGSEALIRLAESLNRI